MQDDVGDRGVVERRELGGQGQGPGADRPAPSNGRNRSSRRLVSNIPLSAVPLLVTVVSVLPK
jgi:hypothetical protein